MAKIFIVHQFPEQIDTVVRSLKSDGHHVFIHFRGLGVRNALIKESPDVIVLDIDRAFLDVKALCTLLHGDPRFSEVPILLSSATLNVSEVRRSAIDVGAQGGVSGSVFLEEIAIQVGQYLLQKLPLFPTNEAKRLKKLRAYRILDTSAEPLFDDLSKVAASVCEAPIALLSLVDENRQWIKARTGTNLVETPREQAFCAHAIHHRQVFEVPDATADVRFEKNPLVLQDPKIRFYAAAPLVSSDGTAAGTLCVLDHIPRSLRPHQREALAALGRVAARLLDERLPGSKAP